MDCPACGKRAPGGSTTCAGCGIIFAKWKPRVAPPAPAPVTTWTVLHLAVFLVATAALFLLRERVRDLCWLLNGVDLAIHESGHLIFGLLGNQFILVAGGTLFQLIMPAAFVVDFRRRGQLRSSDACVAWVGQNLLHIGRYAADARAQELPLVGGGVHDWTYLLEKTGLLIHDIGVGRTFDFAGCVLIAWACVSIWARSARVR